MENLEQVKQEELFELTNILKSVTKALVKENDIDRVYILSLGEETSHFHFHVFPRYKWMLNFPNEDICINDKLDGAKLFSFIRQKYKADKQELFDNRLFSIVSRVRELMTNL
ncbi:hypothetical protein SpAn4DRAFT_2487 [Sporomusa ovata]|uniref:HIT domain-containing protein n=1 Tax=Sporomusa ovata TaxID=2378 RepID=A0A0U1L138_9FIRM|nr:hypothetical protein SpAn4DRAFT_2487 [Sporomusa ovata]